MIVRLLHNLKAAYVKRGEEPAALAVVERLLLIDPNDLTQMRDHGLLLFRLHRFTPALASLMRYLAEAPGAADRAEVEGTVIALRQQMSSMN